VDRGWRAAAVVRPSIDSGMPPRPIALTVVAPIVRVCIDSLFLVQTSDVFLTHLFRAVSARPPTPREDAHMSQAAAPDLLEAAGEAVAALRAAGVTAGTPVAVASAVEGTGLAMAGRCWAVRAPIEDVVRRLSGALAPRWVWWSAHATATPLVTAGVNPTACWDVAAVHRLLHGGNADRPSAVWAVSRGLDVADVPRSGQLDLLSSGGTDEGDPADPVRPDGYLRPDWAEGRRHTAADAARWAALALCLHDEQQTALRSATDPREAPSAPPLAILTAWSESAAELLSVELQAGGLPLDRRTAEDIIAGHVGPRPTDEAAALAGRRARDDVVRRLVTGGADVDLRNPAQVREILGRIGFDVPDTRSWRLEPFRGAHPAIDALLAWRKSERIATTYGYGWLDRHVGADGRLRGAWRGCDGAAGRMTAQAGLHNMPAELRPAVAAEPRHVLVRADLGQIEPRVLAAVSADRALARATANPDLYSPVAARLGCDRPTAKVAVLAAMYGQTSGTAGEALKGLDRAYPVAMAHLRAADEEGTRGNAVRTYGGRRIPMWVVPAPVDPAVAAARGRFARNAVVQGAAAELFKMWAVTVRSGLTAMQADGAQIVLCLHDELLVHVPEPRAGDVVALLHRALDQTGARWAAGSGVRFVADVSVVQRWSDVK
jgi:DNA polymerase family A